MQEEPLKFVDRPKLGNRIATLLVFAASVYMLSRVMVMPLAQPWAKWGVGVLFLFCFSALVREFLFRPVRVTTIDGKRRLVTIEETAPLREKRLMVPITSDLRFVASQSDSENRVSYEVRYRTKEYGMLRLVEYVSKEEAESVARRANAALIA